CWQHRVELEPLRGGLSNTSYCVRHQGDRFVVRLGDDLPEHGVWRRSELAVSQAAHRVGLSPQVFHAEPGVLVLRFIDGAALTAETVRQPDTLERIVPLLQRCHRELADVLRGPAMMFWVFHVIRSYAAQLDARPTRRALMPRLLRLARELEDT